MASDTPSAALRRRTAQYLTAVALVGSAGSFGVGPATADPAPRSLDYTCAFPYIGDKPMTASVTWAPPTYVVGRAAPRSPIDTTATVGGNVSGSLRLIGARTVEGSADVHGVMAAPEGDIPFTVTFTVPKTAVPESGPLTVRASGALPPLTFGEAGRAELVSSSIDLHLIPRDSDGGETPIGKVEAPCDLNSGQKGVVAAFTIQQAAAEPTAPGTATGPGRTSGVAGSGASGAASGSASASATASASTTVRATSGTPSGTASTSRSGAPGTAAPAASRTGGTGSAELLRVAATFLAVSAAVLGCVWWGRRRLRTKEQEG